MLLFMPPLEAGWGFRFALVCPFRCPHYQNGIGSHPTVNSTKRTVRSFRNNKIRDQWPSIKQKKITKEMVPYDISPYVRANKRTLVGY